MDCFKSVVNSSVLQLDTFKSISYRFNPWAIFIHLFAVYSVGKNLNAISGLLPYITHFEVLGFDFNHSVRVLVYGVISLSVLWALLYVGFCVAPLVFRTMMIKKRVFYSG